MSLSSVLGELRDAVKSGHYMAVKLALNSKEEYNLDQEVCFIVVILRPDLVRYVISFALSGLNKCLFF